MLLPAPVWPVKTTKEFAKNCEIAKNYDNIYLALGIHPLNLEDDPDWKDDELIKNTVQFDGEKIYYSFNCINTNFLPLQ